MQLGYTVIIDIPAIRLLNNVICLLTPTDSFVNVGIVGGGVGGALFLVIIVLVIIVCVLVCQVRRRGHVKFVSGG